MPKAEDTQNRAKRIRESFVALVGSKEDQKKKFPKVLSFPETSQAQPYLAPVINSQQQPSVSPAVFNPMFSVPEKMATTRKSNATVIAK